MPSRADIPIRSKWGESMTTAEKKRRKPAETKETPNPVGRPRNLTTDDVNDLVTAFDQYIKETEIPVIAEFAYKNGLTRQTLYDYEEFSTLIKICTEKKEAQLELKSLRGEVNPTQAIFSLKQMGWTDKQHVESNNVNNNLNQDIGGLSPEERRARIDELNRRRGNGTHSTS